MLSVGAPGDAGGADTVADAYYFSFFPCFLPIPQASRDKSKCQGLILCAHPISTSIILDKHLIEQNECFTTESWQIVHLGTP